MTESRAEYHREWRAKKGARTGQPGRPVTRPCGTVAAFNRHKYNGETPCAACHNAYRDHQRQMYLQRKDRQGK